MADNLIATTPKISMHALAFQGIMVYTCYPQIRDMLRRKFGDEYVLLFAEPAENQAEGVIDWYSPVQGAAKPLADLPEEAAGPVYGHVAEMAREILNYAEELIQSREPLKVTRGNILKLALRYPDNKALYMVGEQPVFTCWGFGPGTPGAEGMYLTRLVPPLAAKPARPAQKPQEAPLEEKAATAAAQPSPAPMAPRSWRWLWWLWPLLAAAFLFFLLFSSFGPVGPIIQPALFQLPALPFIKEPPSPSEIDVLAGEVETLRKKADERAALCLPGEKPAPAQEPAKAEELALPDKAEDASFLEGKWHCETGLANALTGEPVSVTFEFDKNGRGTGTIQEKGDVCQGAASAEIINSRLRINVDEQRCGKRDGAYSKIAIDCANSTQGTTICYGVNPDGSRWDATFLKLK